MQFPKKVIWHEPHGDTPGMCCYKNRLTCIDTLFGVIPMGMHGKKKSNAMCSEDGDGKLADYADKTMAVNKVMVRLQHAAGKALLNKAKGIVTVGLAPEALKAGIGVHMDSGGSGGTEMTVNDVRAHIDSACKVKKVARGEDISGTKAQCEMMFDKDKDKAYLLLPPKIKKDGKEEGLLEEDPRGEPKEDPEEDPKELLKEDPKEGSGDAEGEKE